MIKEAGLVFGELEPESFDMPFGFKTGAGIIFGNSGGVAEAVVRHLSSNLNGQDATVSDVIELRGSNGIKRKRITVKERQFNIAVVSGLKNAKELLNKIKSGEESYDFIEVMACPSGCAGGAGQPVTHNSETVAKRGRGLYETDKMLQLHNAHENPLIKEVYESFLETPGSKIAHDLLHTHYKSRKRFEGGISLIQSGEEKKKISVCVGTSCFVKGSQKLLNRVVRHISVEGLSDEFEVSATFCAENCDKGPTVVVEGEIINHCSFEDLKKKIDTFRSE
jgi:NADH-quinone oxidoreductase subunit G